MSSPVSGRDNPSQVDPEERPPHSYCTICGSLEGNGAGYLHSIGSVSIFVSCPRVLANRGRINPSILQAAIGPNAEVCGT
jgi:hypothetical protein